MQPSTLNAGIASRKDAVSESTTDPEASGKAAKMARAALFKEGTEGILALVAHSTVLLSVVTQKQRGRRPKALCRLGWRDKQAKCRQCQLVASSNYDILTSRQS